MTGKTEQVAEAMLPYFPEDSRKSKYLSYRVCGFGVKEAAQLVGVTQTAVRNWRNQDSDFAALDLSGLSQLKKGLSAEFLNLEFTRNFHLVMQKDLNILLKSVTNPDSLTEKENQYLLKLRQFYTPQQYAMIQQLIGEAKSDNFDFTNLIFSIRREREELTVQGVHHALPQVQDTYEED